MRGRLVSIGSAGKTFSFTGWKVGWACASPPLLDAVRTTKQFLTYVNAAPFQHAIAFGLGLGDDYFEGFAASLRDRRDRLAAGLTSVGLDVLPTSGTYFVTTDIRSLGERDGRRFCLSLPERCGVVAITSMVFYDDVEAGRPLVRWTFCKRPEVLDEAVIRLKTLAT